MLPNQRELILLIIAVLFVMLVLSACGTDPNSYTKRGFPPEGKDAFKDYLNENATRASDFVDFGDKMAYLIEWADNGKKWREDLRGAWCLFTTSDIELKNRISSYQFVVYQTTEDTWGVDPSTDVYGLVGCGN